MKQVKQWLKRGLAALLVICMTIGLVPDWNLFKSEASSGYTELTFSDFGITKQTLNGNTVYGENAIVKENGLDKISITGYLTVGEDIGNGAGIIQVANILQIAKINESMFGFWVIGQSGFKAYTKDLGQTIWGKEIKFQMRFDKTGSDYYITIYVDDTYAGGYTIPNGADNLA